MEEEEAAPSAGLPPSPAPTAQAGEGSTTITNTKTSRFTQAT